MTLAPAPSSIRQSATRAACAADGTRTTRTAPTTPAPSRLLTADLQGRNGDGRGWRGTYTTRAAVPTDSAHTGRGPGHSGAEIVSRQVCGAVSSGSAAR